MSTRLFLVGLLWAAAASAAVGLNIESESQQQQKGLPPPAKKSSVSSSTRGTGTTAKMYMLSDVHYDAYFGTPNAVGSCTSSWSPSFGQMTCDGSLPLITSAFDDVFTQASQDSNSIFLLLGDVLRHNIEVFANNNTNDYYQQYAVPLAIAANSTNVIAGMIKDRFSKLSAVIPHPNLLGALGNNDCVPHYFMEKMKNAAAVVNFTEVFLKNGLVSQEEQSEWQQCGYFSRLVNAYNGVQTGPALVLNINSVFYADQASINENGAIADPCGQFAWMTAQMQVARSKGYKVIIIGHVVPMAKKWLDNYIATYITLLQANNDVISSQFFSHTHMFTFVTLTSDDSTAPVFDVPSISPVDGNNPSYVAVTFDKDWRVNEIHHHYLSQDQSSWVVGQTFGSDYSLPSPLTTSSLYNFAQQLMGVDKKDPTWQQFLALYQGGFVSSAMDYGNKDKLKVLCKMISTSEAAYESCRGN